MTHKIASLVFITSASFGGISSSQAQTCENPLPMLSDSVVMGNTANYANTIPVVANGTIPTPGGDIVYRLSPAWDFYSVKFTLHPAPGTPAGAFLCRSCEAPADCIAFADGSSTDGEETLFVSTLPAGTYYIIVDAMVSGIGGEYSLVYTGPIQEGP